MNRLTVEDLNLRLVEHDPYEEPRIIGTLCEQLLKAMRENERLRNALIQARAFVETAYKPVSWSQEDTLVFIDEALSSKDSVTPTKTPE